MDINQNLGNIMKEAQKMQQRMQEAQKQLSALVVTGVAGGGLIKVTMNGRHEVTKVEISQSLMDEDKEMMEDLFTAACNDASRKVEQASKQKISELTAGLNIPTDFMKDSEKE
jgi:DNA-binding YbaB/EbfC family protein